MKAQVGDTVHVRGVVTSEPDKDGDYRVAIHYRHGFLGIATSHVAVTPDSIVHVEPKALAVGDKVCRRGDYYKDAGNLLAIRGASAWVQWSGEPVTVPIGDLVRV